jgi:hypothetical protein
MREFSRPERGPNSIHRNNISKIDP